MDMSAAEIKRAALAQPQTSPPNSPAVELNGSEILVRCLQAEGVRHLWGYPGGAVLYIYDALYKQDTIQHVLVRHEQAAVHAADGFARASGEVGVALGVAARELTDAAGLGVFARELAEAPVVGGDGGVGQGRVELLQAAGQAVER